jgi:hypothetical protein
MSIYPGGFFWRSGWRDSEGSRTPGQGGLGTSGGPE